MIRIVLSVLLLCAVASAESYQLKGAKGHALHFSTDHTKKTAGGQKETVFYRKGIISEAAKVVTTSLLRVRLQPGSDPKSFAQANGIEYVREIDSGLYLFKNDTPLNDMALCAKLSRDKRVIYAVPRFKSRKSLK